MNLLDILKPECILAPLKSTEKRQAIDELVDLIAAHHNVPDVDVLKDAVWTREQTRTTGIGRGLAIPHGKCAGIDSLAMAIGKPSTPLDFEAIDGQPVQLVVLLVSPPDRTSDHIQALARISKLMTMDSFRDRIYAAEQPDEIYQLLKAPDQVGS